MVELLRIETKLEKENKQNKNLASSSADQYRNFLKSRSVFASPGDFGRKGVQGHSFRVRRLSDARIDEREEFDSSVGRVRRSNSSENILVQVKRFEVVSPESDNSASPKRSKIEYFKQLFSKKSDKPKKYLPTPPINPTLTPVRDPPDTYPHFPSDVSTSDYASDNELDEINNSNSPHHKINTKRSSVQLERSSKIASIVKRFESPSKQNPIAYTKSNENDSKALAGIQAITSDLSSLVSNINSLAVNINSAYDGDNSTNSEVLINDSEDESLSKQSDINLDDFLTNLSQKNPLIPIESPQIPPDVNTNTENEPIDKFMDEVNQTISEMKQEFGTDELQKEAIEAKTFPKEGLISTYARPPYLDLTARRLSIEHTVNRILEHPSPKNKIRSFATINPPQLLPSENQIFDPNSTKKFIKTMDNPSNTAMHEYIPSTLANHQHSRSLDDIVEAGKIGKFMSPPELVITPPSPFPISSSSTPNSFDMAVGESDFSENNSVQSMPISSHSPQRHRYTGYSLPPDQSRSVSARIRSLLSGKPIEYPKVDKLTMMRAAIERRKKSISEPESNIDRSVLVEMKQPEDLSVRSLRNRFEQKMKQIYPESVLISPAQLAPTGRRMSEDLIVKPTFAGDTKMLTRQDILSMRSEYNTDEDANTNKSLFQPKYTIK